MIKIYRLKTDKEPFKILTEKEAVMFFLEAMSCSEGSERERMNECLLDIIDGKTETYLYR